MFDEYMNTGFTKEQWDRLDELLNPQRSPVSPINIAHAGLLKEIYLLSNQLDRKGYPQAPPAQPAPPPASPPAQKPCAQTTTPELPPQPIPTPVPARSYPPSPSVEAIEEVELKQVYKIPLRNVKQMRQKHRASKTCVVEFLENWIAWPPRFGGIYMHFSRDEEPDAWYTTMLNAIDALPHRT